MMRCAGCSKALYCGKECQVAAWKGGHKAACAKGKNCGGLTGRCWLGCRCSWR